MKQISLIILLFISFFYAQAQRPIGGSGSTGKYSGFSVSGKVLEANTSQAMEYCTVSIFDVETAKLVNGTITNDLGVFSLVVKVPGKYFLKVSYIGFETKEIKAVNLNFKNPNFKVKDILLKSNASNINEVEVTGMRSTVRYEMDKKVVDVSKNIAATNGSAVDALESAPSIQVDVDGTVKLRGNSNFLVLVDGKPSTLEGSEALQQIPAANIKNIEIITNPSAKYEAGNAAGIINIILKTEKKIGTSGLVSINVGTYKNYGGNINIKHNIKKLSFEFSANLRNRAGPRIISDSLFTSNSDEIYTLTAGEKIWTFGGYSFNYGMGYKLAKNHGINLDMVYGKWYMLVDDESSLYQNNTTKNEIKEVNTINDTYRGAPYFGPSLSYNGSFKNKSNLAAYVGYSQRDFSEEVLNDNFNADKSILSGSKTAEKASNRKITAKIDYTLPIKTGKLEFGFKTRNVISSTVSKAFDLNLADLAYLEIDYSNPKVDFNRSVHGGYISYGDKIKKFSYSLGFRAEYTDRKLKLANNLNSYDYYKWNYVPTASVGYKFDDSHQIYANYSTRVQRPMGWQIEPQIIKTAVNSYFSGNKDLRISEINSVDVGWVKSFKKKSTRVSFEFFYDLYQDNIEFITESYLNGSTLTKPENAGRINNFGLEGNFGTNFFKWWNVELSATGFYSIYDVNLENTQTQRRRFEGNVNLNNYFIVSKSTKLQLTTRFNSLESTALGYNSAQIRFGLGIKQSFLDKALNLSLNVRNLLNTANNFGEDTADNYYYYHSAKPVWPKITIGLSYKINNYRQTRRQNESSQGQL